VTKDKGVDLKELISSKRTEKISNTRAIISYLAGMELNNSGKDIAEYLHLSEKSVSRCIERGKKLISAEARVNIAGICRQLWNFDIFFIE